MEVKPITSINTVKSVTQRENLPKETVPQEMKNQQGQAIEPVENNTEIQVEKKDVEKIAEIMNKASELYNHQLNFEVFEDTNRLYVQIIDKNTQEVIKQIPPEEMLKLSAKIQEMVGIMLDKYV